MEAREIMTAPVETLHVDASLDEAWTLMKGLGVRHLPLMRDGALAGLVSDRDLLEATGALPARVREIYQDPAQVRHETVGALARPAPTMAPDEDPLPRFLAAFDAAEAAQANHGCTTAPPDRPDAFVVVELGEPVGIVTEVDVLRAWLAAPAAEHGHALERIMCRKVAKVHRDTTLAEARALLADVACHHLPVFAEEGLVGVISERDLRRALGANRKPTFPIGELMSEQPHTASPRDSLATAAVRMLDEGIGALPVLDAGELVGIVTTTDLLRSIPLRR